MVKLLLTAIFKSQSSCSVLTHQRDKNKILLSVIEATVVHSGPNCSELDSSIVVPNNAEILEMYTMTE